MLDLTDASSIGKENKMTTKSSLIYSENFEDYSSRILSLQWSKEFDYDYINDYKNQSLGGYPGRANEKRSAHIVTNDGDYAYKIDTYSFAKGADANLFYSKRSRSAKSLATISSPNVNIQVGDKIKISTKITDLYRSIYLSNSHSSSYLKISLLSEDSKTEQVLLNYESLPSYKYDTWTQAEFNSKYSGVFQIVVTAYSDAYEYGSIKGVKSGVNVFVDDIAVYREEPTLAPTFNTDDFIGKLLGARTPSIIQTQDLISKEYLDVVTSSWSDKVKITRIARASDAGDKLEAKQIDYGAGEVAGSVVSGGKGNDDIKGFAGWDILDGGEGNDLIHGGNGRDIITGGAGRDELHGDFGWNTFKTEKDGDSDLIAVKSDQYLVNWLYGKAGNNPNGEKTDIIEGLDAIDKIKIIGVDTRDLTFAENVIAHGATGIGIYGKGALEALYVGGDLTVAQITQMTSGDASAAALSNSVNAYGVW